MGDIRRFARNQATDNIGILLFDLAQECMKYLEYELYGTSHKHGLGTIFTDDRLERAEDIAIIAMELLQEVGMTKEQIMQAWDKAQVHREDLEKITQEMQQKEG